MYISIVKFGMTFALAKNVGESLVDQFVSVAQFYRNANDEKCLTLLV